MAELIEVLVFVSSGKGSSPGRYLLSLLSLTFLLSLYLRVVASLFPESE
jgi:hypothetical protein